MCILDPLDLHRLEGAAAYDFVDPTHHGYGSAVLELFDNGPSLCKKTD